MSVPGADSSTPQPNEYAGKKWWGVYVGGDTPHVWSNDEVKALATAGVTGALPIVVAPLAPFDSAVVFSQLLIQAAQWPVPKKVPLVLDVEQQLIDSAGTAVNDYVEQWGQMAKAAGYEPWVYGSAVLEPIPAAVFHWLAQWPNPAPVDPPIPYGWSAWQYESDTADAIDLDAMTEGAYSRLMLTATLQAPTLTPPKPQSVSVHLPVLQDGMANHWVGTLHALLNAKQGTTFGHTNETFGPNTVREVTNWQHAHKLPVTHTVDAVTWSSLLAAPAI